MASSDSGFYQYGSEGSEHALPPAGSAPPGTYKFSPEEIRTLKECNTESFFQRSLPLGTVFGFGTFAAIQRGTLKANPRFGPYPKVTLAVIVGYFLGKLSYQRACADKLMALPNSYIGQLLRQKRDSVINPGKVPPPGVPPLLGAGPDDVYSDAGPGSSLDLDLDRPLFSDDGGYLQPLQPDGASGAGTGAADGAGGGAGGGGGALSYDELRRRNRGQYADARQDPYRMDPNPVGAAARPRRGAEPAPPTNKYGDAMD